MLSLRRVAGPVPSEDKGLTAIVPDVPLSFEDVYKNSFAFVFRNAKRLGVSDESVDDVVQEVFLVVHRRLHDYDGRVPIQGWIYGILSHVVRAHRRAARRRLDSIRTTGLEAETNDHVSSAVEPSKFLEQKEAAHLLMRILDQLDDDKRELLVLSELEQMTVPEIAEAIGANVNTVYSRVKAARKAFAEARVRELARAVRGRR